MAGRSNSKKRNGNSSFFPKKFLGQNFLINPQYRDKIIQACEIDPDDTVLEIGPGKGFLTGALSERAKKIFAVEKDYHLAQELKKNFDDSHVEVIHDDILKFDFGILPSPYKVIGNLPYNIATPIITKIIEERSRCQGFYMTVQLEYGQRMLARPHTKEYGSFSCYIQYYGAVKKFFNIPPTAFHPRPKVQSCFIKMTPHTRPEHKASDEVFLFEIIRHAFQQRRKMMLNSLGNFIDRGRLEDALKDLRLDPQLRAEDITLKEYVALANILKKNDVQADSFPSQPSNQ